MRIFLLTLVLIVPSLAVAGCEDDSPVEEVGEDIEDAVDPSEGPVEATGEQIEEAAEDTREAVDDAVE